MQSFFWKSLREDTFPFSVLEYLVTGEPSDGEPPQFFHHFYELCLCIAGEGELCFGEQRCPCRAGDLFLVNDLEKHGAVAEPGKEIGFRLFLFSSGFLIDGESERDMEFLLPFRQDHHVIAGDSPAGRALSPHLEGIWNEATQIRAGRERLLRARLFHCLAELSSQWNLEDGREALSDYMKIRPAVAHIDAHFTGRVAEQETADRCELSESRFRHLFRQELGVSFQRYITMLRYLEARRVLAVTDAPVSTTARSAGFSNPYYFYKMFREIEGCTPNEWRKKLRLSRSF